MSTHTSTSATVTAVVQPTNAELIRRVVADRVGGRMAPGLTSHRLRVIADERTVDVDARWTRLQSESGTIDVLRAAEPTLVDGASRRIADRHRALAAGDEQGARRLAVEAGELLDQALADTADRLAGDERIVIAEASVRALESRGFSVDRHDAVGASGLWAVRGDQAMAVAIADGGAMATDVAGCTDGSCELVVDDFVRALSDQGVAAEVHRTDAHDDAAGGALIRTAAAAGRASMAHAVAEEAADPTVPTARRRIASRPVNRIGRAR